MTDKELAHRINEEILAHTETALIEAERDRVTVRSRTPEFEEYIAGEIPRLQALRTEYLEKTRASGEALKTEADAQQKEERDAILRSMGVEPRKEPAWQIEEMDAMDALLRQLAFECEETMPSGLHQLIRHILVAHKLGEPMSPMDRGLCNEG